MTPFIIKPGGKYLYSQLQHKINDKAKSLGDLEKLAIKIGRIQGTETPKLTRPVIVLDDTTIK